jgi:hypothetical protein
MDFNNVNKETLDHKYLSIGPHEKILLGNCQINLKNTNTGKHMVKGFLEHLSGLYVCTLLKQKPKKKIKKS